MPLEGVSETAVLDNFSLEDSLPYLIAIGDSVFQFELMTVEEDYERVEEGGDYLSRKMLRVHILLKRLEVGQLSVDKKPTKSSGKNSGRSVLTGWAIEKFRWALWFGFYLWANDSIIILIMACIYLFIWQRSFTYNISFTTVVTVTSRKSQKPFKAYLGHPLTKW